jgi:type IV pilus assembly protein PilA
MNGSEMKTRNWNQGMRFSRGFSLIELMMVVTVIGIVSSIAIPSLVRYRELAQVRAVASNMKTFAQGFETYRASLGGYPPDWHLDGPYHLPPRMEDFIPGDIWAAKTPLGGNYNWEGPNNYPYAGISIYQVSASSDLIDLLDDMLDDGDTSQGKFRIPGNGRPTYILEE